MYESGLHAESIVGGKFLVEVQFVRQGLEIGVQLFTAFLKFTYGEGGGLVGVCEGPGLHGEMHCGMRC